MHTAWVRLNAVVFFGLTVLLGLSVLTALSTYLHKGFPDVRKLGVSKFRNFRKSEGTDRLLLNIDLDADLAPAFNWNVKQLFTFVAAEYKTKTNTVNQVILWDKVIESADEAHLIEEDVTIKYSLIDELYLNLVEYLGVASTCTAIQLDDVTMQSAVSLLSGLLELRK